MRNRVSIRGPSTQTLKKLAYRRNAHSTIDRFNANWKNAFNCICSFFISSILRRNSTCVGSHRSNRARLIVSIWLTSLFIFPSHRSIFLYGARGPTRQSFSEDAASENALAGRKMRYNRCASDLGRSASLLWVRDQICASFLLVSWNSIYKLVSTIYVCESYLLAVNSAIWKEVLTFTGAVTMATRLALIR